MLTLNDGRAELWQWDTGRTLAVDADCSQVHFSNKVFGRSIDVDVIGGAAIIPDILLQTDKDLNVWAFVGTAENGYTKISKTFKVNRRNKPADYVFTPPDQTTLAELSGRLDRIEESQSPDAIKNAVDDYLKQNPVEAPVDSVNGKTGAVQLTAADVGAIAYETDPTVPGWAKQPEKPTYTAAEVGALPDTYTPPVDSTLTQSGQAADAATVGERLSSLSEEIVTTAESKVSTHNTGTDTHSDIRMLIQGLTDRLNALADSDDTTLDQLSEVVAYIKSNRALIEAITTSKVNVADIVDNLTTNIANKPLSAAQGVALKALIDAITVPDKLPNPNALTFTGAVTGSYDGSEPVTVNIPSGGSGVADISLGITGAQVGQIAKITAVDTEGKPTAWSTVDMVGGEKWEKIAEIIIPEGADEVTALTINKDFDGNPFSLVKARLCAKFPKYTGATTIPKYSFAMLNGKTSGRVTPLAYTSVWPKVSASNITGTVYEIDVSGAQQFENVKKSGNGGWADDSSHEYVAYGSISDTDATWFGDTLWAKPITSIGGTSMLIYPGCRFVLYGVRA